MCDLNEEDASGGDFHGDFSTAEGIAWVLSSSRNRLRQFISRRGLMSEPNAELKNIIEAALLVAASR